MLLAVAVATGRWPDRTRARGWYRAAYAVPTGRYALAALAGPVVLILAIVAAGSSVVTARGVLLVLYLGVAAGTDLLWRRIPNWLTVAAVAWVAGLHLLAPAGAPWCGLPDPADSAAGALACLGLMVVMHLTFRGGEGDVKLLIGVGALLGAWHGVEALALGYCSAGTVAVVLLLGRALGVDHPAVRARTLPMAPFFALGVLLTLRLPGSPG